MRLWRYVFGILLLILAVLIISISQIPDSNLHVITCDVGQGDAILISYGATQILTDGGPDKSVLTCLGKHLPFWDREIELVVSTHPDADHITGLITVLQNYKVDEILINPVDPGTSTFQALKKAVGGRGVAVVNPSKGMRLGSGLIYLDILEPSDGLFGKLSSQESGDNLSRYSISGAANLYSIVYLLSFKNFSGLFVGDTPSEISNELAAQWPLGNVDYIKVPHHGSNNGLTQNLLEVVQPKVAAISLGKNSWGFPREEILDMLAKYKVKVFRTDQVGDIEIVTDGEKFWKK
jgi:competence protein ComEC